MRFSTMAFGALLVSSLYACGGSPRDEGDSVSVASSVADQAGVDQALDLQQAVATHPLFSGEAMGNLASFMQGAEVGKAMSELQEKAEGLMGSDPVAALGVLGDLAKLAGSSTGLTRQMGEMQVQSLQSVLANYRDPGRLLSLGREQFLLGRFAQAEASLREARELGIDGTKDQIAALCWEAASAAARGADQRSAVAIAQAKSVLEEQAKAARLAARSRAEQQRSQFDQGWTSLESVLGPVYSDYAPAGGDNSILGLGGDVGGFADYGGGFGANGGQIYQEYLAAKADYEAEQARYESEASFANQRSGRFAVQGIEVNPRPVSQAVYSRYLNAKRAYENAQGGK